ncbi:TolC family protein [Puniceicoccaceae bacterium K14]|nr:TolC family protein [Puniceicoccaceae bacterium K14]
MKIRSLSTTLIALSSLVTHLVAQTNKAEDATHTIAIIKDGDSQYFDEAAKASFQELQALAEGNYTIEQKNYNANYDPEQVSAYLEEALGDPSIDLVYAAGVIATERAANLEEDQRSKPILGGALQFSNIRGNAISPDGTSRLSNYTFITSPRRVSADMNLLAQLSDKPTLSVLIDERLIPELRDMPQAKAEVEAALGKTIKFLSATNKAAETIAQIPQDVTALYVTLMPRMSVTERRLLYQGLTEKGILTVTMNGHIDVKLGALAGLATDSSQSIARRTALNIHQMLQGVNTESLPVYLPVFDRLLINNETAFAIDWSPDYDTSLSAEFLGQQSQLASESMTLVQAMKAAAEKNIDVVISREDQAATEYDIDITRGQLRPNLSGEGSLAGVRTSDRINTSSTPTIARNHSLGLQLTQILFSGEAWSGLRAQQKTAEASRFLTQSSELDAIDSTVDAYFNYLTAKRLAEIERENLSLTENNFQLAKLRIEIGAAEPSESYRWEQSAASDRSTLIQRESDRANALIEFNRQIGAPREALWTLEDIEIEDDELYFIDEQLNPLIVNAKDFRDFGRFIQAFSVENAPELIAFDLQLAAQGGLLRHSERRFRPDIVASLQYARVFQSNDFVSSDSQNEATAGISLSLPLFESGGRKAEVFKNKASIRRLAAEREKAVQQIEQRSLTAFYSIRAAHPNMRLSRASLEAAEKNYQSIQEKYSQGAASILDLLDAQESLLLQKQAAATAIYDYLKGIHQLQRSIAWYEFDKNTQEKQELADLFTQFISSGETTQNTDSVRKQARSDALKTIESSLP